MSAGKINIQANDGAVIGLVVPDGLTSGERQISLGSNTGSLVPYHLLQGNLAVSNSTITKGFDTTLYTSGSATTNIDMDTQWGSTAEEKFGGLIWLKDRVEATSNFLYDTIRGATKEINSNTGDAEATLAGGLTAFNSTGFTVGADTGHNSTTNNMVSWNFQTTHRRTGATNQGQAYTEHWNPYTGFTIIQYSGSGLAGHEIIHSLGRKLGFVTVKSLSAGSTAWQSTYDGINRVYLNLTNAQNADSNVITLNENSISLNNSAGTLIDLNASSNTYIMYGWANSYLDKANKLIGNYEIGMYQGTGASGNKVPTRGKPAWLMFKRIDAVADWYIFDNQRDTTNPNNAYLLPDASNIEQIGTTFGVNFLSDGFALLDTATNAMNASSGQYLYIVAYDTNATGGGSYYPLASDTANVQVSNALIPLAQGIDGNGVKNTILSKNETITGLTYTQGKNYVYCDKNGSYGVTPYKPRYLESELVRTFASEAPEYYDVGNNKWFSTSGQGELITNGTFNSNTTGWTGVNGIIANPSGTLQFTANLSVLAYVYTSISTTVGNTYTLKVTTNSMTDSQVWLYVGSSYNSGDAYLHNGVTSPWTLGVKEVVFTAVSTTTYICFRTDNGRVINLDSISTFIKDITPTTEITNSRNYLNHIVHADNDGGVLYVEELPKIEYKDIIKANEFRGKNACTAWALVDGISNPPKILDGININSVIKTMTGVYKIYQNKVDDINYGVSVTRQSAATSQTTTASEVAEGGGSSIKTLDSFTIALRVSSAASYDQLSDGNFYVEVKGGKN